MKVCIAEKPSVAREIAEVLGVRTRRDGYIEGNGYCVTWTFGHLCTLKEPHDYKPEWKHWLLSSLPVIPVRFGIKLMDSDSYKKQFGVIASLVKNAEMIINCGDAGQEGELIQRWVLQKAEVKCPVMRLWISSLTEEAIREGFMNLRPQSDFDRLYSAGVSRAIGDWLLGINATRLYTIRYGQGRHVLSIGRVQTPTLALVVARQNEIEKFVPEQSWDLKTVYRNVTFTASSGKFATEKDGAAVLENIKGHDFEITGVTKKKGKEYAPRLFDLTSLQVECNRKFSFTAEETLRMIQSIYEKKVATYPRVDTVFLSDDIYSKVPGILEKMTGYVHLTSPLKGVKLPRSKRVFDNSKVTDHHAIIPTGVSPSSLSPEEMKVYDLIARRFIAVFYPDCEISTTTVTGKAADIDFKTSGKQILKQGWRQVFRNGQSETGKDNIRPDVTVTESAELRDAIGQDESRSAEEVNVLPDFRKGEHGQHFPILKESWTTPPKPYTEATLLRAMETAGKFVDDEELRDAMKENGIGRPSTRAAIIETLFKRNYIRKERKSIYPTSMGVKLVSIIRDDLLKSAELTGIWEKKLRLVEKGEYNAADFVSELKKMTTEMVEGVISDRTVRFIELD